MNIIPPSHDPKKNWEWTAGHIYQFRQKYFYLCTYDNSGTMSLSNLATGAVRTASLPTDEWEDVTDQYSLVHNSFLKDAPSKDI